MAVELILSMLDGGTTEEWGTTPDEVGHHPPITGGHLNFTFNSSLELEAPLGVDIDMIFNLTSVDDVKNLATDFRFMTLLLSLLFGVVWAVYIIFYSSRVIGLALTFIINLFIKKGCLQIGSVSMSVLSGKVMFRNVAYITEDFSLRIQDGWMIFRWWRSYEEKQDISEDMSQSDTRLSILLNGFECHVYNRSEVYSRLERLFGLESWAFPEPEHTNNNDNAKTEKPDGNLGKPASSTVDWRDLIPVIKLELSYGRVVFGNTLVPYNLDVVVDEAHLIYTTKTATSSSLDKFMHIVKGRCEDLKVVLSQSSKYMGLKDEPPRRMGEGFELLSSNKMDLLYYMDEPGVVPSPPELLQLENGDLVEAHPPMQGIDIKFGKGTDINYGPWADRQRDLLYKLFYPQDYQVKSPTPTPLPGELRRHLSFDLRLTTKDDANINILFKNEQETTSVIHMDIGPDSNLEMVIPWTTGSDGYTSEITGQLLNLKSSTPLQYRAFVESDMLQFHIKSRVPIHWNEHQDWELEFTGYKTSASLIYAHKWFFQGMLDDWARRTAPDILTFVPYTYRIHFSFKEFEVIVPVNEWNWIDCSGQDHDDAENNLIAACGEQLDLSIELPFHEFLPETVPFTFKIEINEGFLNFLLPQVSTAFIVAQSLSKTAKIRSSVDGVTMSSSSPLEYVNNRRRMAQVDDLEDMEGSKLHIHHGMRNEWRKCRRNSSWIECWSVPSCVIKVNFTYHPMPPMGPSPQADLSVEDKEKKLLNPIRIPGEDEDDKKQSDKDKAIRDDFDPTLLSADKVEVEVEVGPSELLFYGSFLKLILNFKENVFGDHQAFIDMEELRIGASYPATTSGKEDKKKSEAKTGVDEAIKQVMSMEDPSDDPRKYRPLEVTVSAQLREIKGHLLKHCNEKDPPCPIILIERLGFEMSKKLEETRLQVLLSPAVVLVSDRVPRDDDDKHLAEGHLMLSGLQVRGHSMFSNEGRSPDQDTLEYAWLIEIQLGRLSGRLSTPQLEVVMSGLQGFLLTVLDEENGLRSPQPFLHCLHGNNQFDCGEHKKDNSLLAPRSFISPADICPTSEAIKYEMLRVSIDAVDLYLAEEGTALSLWASPIRLSNCNLHGRVMQKGVTLLLPDLQLRQFVMVNQTFSKTSFRFSDISISQSSLGGGGASPQKWLEVGAVTMGPLCMEVAEKGDVKLAGTQLNFLLKHDRKTERLWFLWKLKSGNTEHGRCACAGGCAFFGGNIGGARFFLPSKNDWRDGVNVTCFKVNPDGEDVGYGQSILKKKSLVFEDEGLGGDDSSVEPEGMKLLSEPVNRNSIFSSAHRHSTRRKIFVQSVERNRISSSKLGQLDPSLPEVEEVVKGDVPPSRLSWSSKNVDEMLRNYLRKRGSDDDNRRDSDDGSGDSLDSLSDANRFSFSGLSIQEEYMVNLQQHLNKPITESSILMPCYMSHLTQFKCEDWLTKGPTTGRPLGFEPLVQIKDDGRVNYSGSKFTPSFELLSDGFTTLSMIDVKEKKSGQYETCQIPPCRTSFWGQDRSTEVKQDAEDSQDIGSDDFYGAIFNFGMDGDPNSSSSSESTTVVIRAKNDINILASPMLPEALEKFAEAITPTLSSLHPLTVLDNLHGDCISRVEGDNLLKKERSSLLLRMLKLKRQRHTSEFYQAPSILFEETLQRAYHGSISLPKINLALLQASMVEEVISFSALENIRDLMCVSMVAVAVEESNVCFLFREKERKTVQVMHRPAILPSKAAKKGRNWRSRVSRTEGLLGEPVFIENSERESELISASFEISRVHGQLRRLKNDSSVLKEAVITAIPKEHSKVLFRFGKIPSNLAQEGCSEGLFYRQDSSTSEQPPPSSGEKLGFILCECGLVGVSIKGVKNTEGDHRGSSLGKDKSVNVTFCNELNSAEVKSDADPSLKSREKGEDAASASCVIDFRKMWFNFAAPPQISITKKVDYTRVDWNLVSTASTAINAWLNPINQLTSGIKRMQRGYSRRTTALLACLMAEALEMQPIHQPNKSKFHKLTPMAETLLEDPSCQLCVVLRRYIAQTEMDKIERNLEEVQLPQLSTLRQGVIVLSRQWKNVLYNPLLLEHNFTPRKSKNLNVRFSFPQNDEDAPNSDEESDSDTSDETAKLLDIERGTASTSKDAMEGPHVEDAAVKTGGEMGDDEEGKTGAHPRSMKGQRHFSSEQSYQETILLEAHTQYPQHPGLVLLDAHIIFKPLLTNMGLMPEQIMGYSFDNLGSHLSFKVAIELLRIDIVESEAPPGSYNFVLHQPAEAAAFLCEKIDLGIDFKKMANMNNKDGLNRRSILHPSRSYWRKQARKAIIFSMNIECISQQVNMPLLRLIHQITTTFQNVKKTQMELKEQRLPQADSSSSDEEPAVTVEQNLGKPKLFEDQQDSMEVEPPSTPMSRVSRKISSALAMRTQSFAQRFKASQKIQGVPVVNPTGGPGLTPPTCWRTIYYLLDLYATKPETKMVVSHKPLTPLSSVSFSRRTKVPGAVSSDHPHISVFGIARIQNTKLLATLSGLKLEAEIVNLQTTGSYKKKLRPATEESSFTGHVGRSMIMLLEGDAPNQKTLVTISVSQSDALYSSESRRLSDKNCAMLTIGPIAIDIPQHPVALHGMVTRSRNRLSTTLQEFRVNRQASRISRGTGQDEMDFGGYRASTPMDTENNDDKADGSPPLIKPIELKFSIRMQSLGITASLLPSLQAQYKMEMVKSCGITGSRAAFQIKLPIHALSFTTKLSMVGEGSTLPSSACISLPQIDVNAKYLKEGHSASPQDKDDSMLLLRTGSHLSAVADIATFEHSLTTDLLNHLVFVQKVFVKEVNEVVLKMSGGGVSKPVLPLRNTPIRVVKRRNPFLFDLAVRLQRIQITATTPTSTAVRLETGLLKFKVSNRAKTHDKELQGHHDVANKVFINGKVDVNLSLGQLMRNVMFEEAEPEYQQLAFFKTRIGLRNSGDMATSGNPTVSTSSGGEKPTVVIVTLTRPLIHVQPIAVDKAILVWLNYKSAYEYWHEQRRTLNYEVMHCTVATKRTELDQSEVLEEQEQGHHQTSEVPPTIIKSDTLFLQVTVDDLGISIPLNPVPNGLSSADPEIRGAVVVTLASTSISACSSGSLVSKGKFKGLCIRFTEDVLGLDDWKPNMSDPALMNFGDVSEGTFEICSRTISKVNWGEGIQGKNAKLLLNVQWQMEGVNIHMDVNIGKQLSALGHTLTTLAALEEEDQDQDEKAHVSTEDVVDGTGHHQTTMKMEDPSSSSSLLTVPTSVIPRHKNSIQEMQETITILDELNRAGSPQDKIDAERKKLEELENLASREFRRDLVKKLRRQSTVRVTRDTKDDKGQNVQRSKSLVRPPPSSSKLPRWRQHRSLTASKGEDGGLMEELLSELSGENMSMGQTDTVDGSSQSTNKHEGYQEGADNFTSPPPKPQEETNVDLELDVKVVISSGKCVLHTKAIKSKEGGGSSKKRNRKWSERSGSEFGSHFNLNSPASTILSRNGRQYLSTTRLKSPFGTPVPGDSITEVTVFYIPGLDVKIHYDSFTEYQAETASNHYPNLGIKKASMFAWVTLQSVPETIVSPHILDFFDQTLESIPVPVMQPNGGISGSSNNMKQEESSDGEEDGAAGTYYESFPVDVIVYFHMHPSTFRFTCQPVSRMECMLRLPSLDVVFSSKMEEFENSPSSKGIRQRQPLQHRSSTPINSTTKSQTNLYRLGMPAAGKLPGRRNSLPPAAGAARQSSYGVWGFSVTGCLSDYSLYIFHPYGTAKKTDRWNPLNDSERKDSVTMHVEFVKFNLSRSRKVHFMMEEDKWSSSTSLAPHNAAIRFSSIIDIGSATFKYDMRRLTEILAFPKAWYRRSLIRRVFLGDITSGTSQTPSSPPSTSTSPTFATHEGDEVDPRRKERKRKVSGTESHVPPTLETVLLFAVNFNKLAVQMNMGNVMGNVDWLIRDAKSEGKLSIGSNANTSKSLYIGMGLNSSYIEAKGGIIAGTFELSNLSSYLETQEHPGKEPRHTTGLKMEALELRLDFMGTIALMGRVSGLQINLKDEWQVMQQQNKGNKARHSVLATYRPAMIFAHGDLGWDQLQLMISKSTTVDLFKIKCKLEEFFSQQFKSSKWLIENMLQENSFDASNMGNRADHHQSKEDIDLEPFQQPHCHWQKVLSKVRQMTVSSMLEPFPDSGTVLGGTMKLHGRNISLACFHGINFKAKSWALFSLKDGAILFSTEAQETIQPEGGHANCHVIQNLNFTLGSQTSVHPENMATVCKVTRNVMYAPQFRTLHEWFHYAFAPSDIDDVERFPSLELRERSNSGIRLRDPNHNLETIFALPSLELYFKTEQFQFHSAPSTSSNATPRPVVECSFITEFGNHIIVSVDAEAFLFLHDLITSYIREKDKLMSAQLAASGRTISTSASQYSPKSPRFGHPSSPTFSYRSRSNSASERSPSPTTTPSTSTTDGRKDKEAQRDWRDYQCNTWHLEPTVRLLSWAGKSIEPYGMDYILQKLGFSHARITIPKWMQRGVGDPLDEILSLLIFHMVGLASRK